MAGAHALSCAVSQSEPPRSLQSKMAATGKRGSKNTQGKSTAATKKKPGRPKKVVVDTPEADGDSDKEKGVELANVSIQEKASEEQTEAQTQEGVPEKTHRPLDPGTGTDNNTAKHVDQSSPSPVNDIGDLDGDIEGELCKAIEGDLECDDDDNASELWTPKKEDKLIDMFEKCSFLYDKEHDDYWLRNKKLRAFTAFAKKLGVECK